MGRIRSLALAALLMSIWTVSALGNGILRTPGLRGDDLYLPLRAMHVNIEIHDQVAITTVQDVFHIDGDAHIDANFHYRLPLSASVVDFGYWNGDHFIRYNLREGEQGGPGAGGGQDNQALRAYLGQNPFNIFLDSIPPGDMKIQISFAELLPYDFGVVSETYPFALGNFLANSIDTMALTVNVQSQRQMTEMTVSGEQSNATRWHLTDQYHASATLNLSNFRPSQDWKLNIRFNQEDIGGWLYTCRSDTTEQGYFMLVVEPGIVDPDEQVQKFFTFVFDRSGSMAGTKMDQAKSAASITLSRLANNDYFNIIDFASNVATYHAGMLQATAANRNTARNYINNLQPNGATNIFGALTTAVNQQMGQQSANQVVFITDGQPTIGQSTNPDSIMAAVRRANQFNARIYCFGIGQDLNLGLLNGLAMGNRGQAFTISPQDARIDSVVDNFYKYVATPALVNPTVQFDNRIGVDSLAPPELQDISAGHQMYLFGRYSNFGTYGFSLNGQMAAGDTSFEFENFNFPRHSEENQFVPRMWAKATIDYWLTWLAVHGEHGNQDVINKIVELSLRFNILTPYTEFEEPPNAINDPAIALVSAETCTDGVLITWEAVGVASSVTYNIYRSQGIEEPFVKLNTSPLYQTSYLDVTANRDGSPRYMVEMIVDGESIWSGVVTTGLIPVEISLDAPYPNPFNAVVNIDFSLPNASDVKVGIYDAKGSQVTELVSGMKQAGKYSLIWNASNKPAGIYFVRLENASTKLSQKIVLLK